MQVHTFLVYSINMNTKDDKNKNNKAHSECQDICPSENTLSIIDGKWSIKILHYLMNEQVLRFGELRSRIPDITQRMLTHKLRQLEDKGVVQRVVYPQVPPKVEYSLTDLGKSLKPVLDSLTTWSVQNKNGKHGAEERT